MAEAPVSVSDCVLSNTVWTRARRCGMPDPDWYRDKEAAADEGDSVRKLRIKVVTRGDSSLKEDGLFLVRKTINEKQEE